MGKRAGKKTGKRRRYWLATLNDMEVISMVSADESPSKIEAWKQRWAYCQFTLRSLPPRLVVSKILEKL